VVAGDIDLKREQALIDEARGWIEERAGECPGLEKYLAAWGEWQNPWA
jgi:hypothetical protein